MLVLGREGSSWDEMDMCFDNVIMYSCSNLKSPNSARASPIVFPVRHHEQINKLTSVFYASVLLLMVICFCDDKLRHNIVKVAVEPRAAGGWFRSKL